MVAYLSVGASDITHAKRFYTAFLPALGYALEESEEGLSFALIRTSPDCSARVVCQTTLQRPAGVSR